MKPVAQLRARARTCATRGNLNSAKQCHPGQLPRAAKPENGIVRLIGFRCERLITIAVSAPIYDALMFKKSFSPLQTF